MPGDKPVSQLSEQQVQTLLYGSDGEKVRIHYTARDGRQAVWETPYEGVIPNLRRRFEESTSDYIRDKISEYMAERPCEVCHGLRLRPEALAGNVLDKHII